MGRRPFHQASLSAVSTTAKLQQNWSQLTVKATIMTHSHSQEPRGAFREQDPRLDWIRCPPDWLKSETPLVSRFPDLLSLLIFKPSDMMLCNYTDAKKQQDGLL